MPAQQRHGDIATIVFNRAKYGVLLDADASEVAGLANFITVPAPHRLQFYELVLLRDGAGTIDIDGHSFALRAGRVLCSRPGEVRCWRLDAALGGLVVCFLPELFDSFFADTGFVDRLPFFAPAPRLPSVDPLASANARLEALAETMRAELLARRADSQHMLRALTYQILLELARCVPEPRSTREAARVPARLVQRFQTLVERQFRREHRVRAYAQALGVTASHLNASLRLSLGRSAGSLIQERQLLEARRLLLYGSAPVHRVAAQLGFRDASYFSRFFKRLAGSTPLALRRSFVPCQENDRK